uniref:Uncharacterized protein LOC117361949 isoform X2 n=1 Tax=Geotrypetes seraphini TaxID=260995 RepID=A0A6P8RJG1_GEOSA|nr:uncharacterized protein LOC117361949 isoform X2 [Geotrypetes seraphini]
MSGFSGHVLFSRSLSGVGVVFFILLLLSREIWTSGNPILGPWPAPRQGPAGFPPPLVANPSPHLRWCARRDPSLHGPTVFQTPAGVLSALLGPLLIFDVAPHILGLLSSLAPHYHAWSRMSAPLFPFPKGCHAESTSCQERDQLKPPDLPASCYHGPASPEQQCHTYPWQDSRFFFQPVQCWNPLLMELRMISSESVSRTSDPTTFICYRTFRKTTNPKQEQDKPRHIIEGQDFLPEIIRNADNQQSSSGWRGPTLRNY